MKTRIGRIGKIVFAMGVTCTALWALDASVSPVDARGGCVCPMVYAPVVCDNGKTYSNLCVARCAHAKGCEPIPLYPPLPY
jgi:hypothetical protein